MRHSTVNLHNCDLNYASRIFLTTRASTDSQANGQTDKYMDIQTEKPNG